MGPAWYAWGVAIDRPPWPVGWAGYFFQPQTETNGGNMKFRRITPFLWFDGNAPEAAKFYCKIFKSPKSSAARP
jgi:hypothetical protein